uniref:UDP-3-O-(3-hydroxymyristoyl)glucosamine N-acyltransferase n=1 Tax=Ningiella ruwaisensis TaxID=2364274 RepID=UPI00109F882F|nr:UDP-3-O-(3-hydroxymyristoyl)glucosamine N-acyltransferase [Ningiella ruwaisensis]
MSDLSKGSQSSNSFTLAEIASHIGGEVSGDAQHKISSMGTLASADASQLSFLSNPKYTSELKTSKAGAVILAQAQADEYKGNAIIHSNPYVGFALASQLLDSTPSQSAGISVNASISQSASIGKNVSIEAGAVIGKNVVIGDGCQIGAGVYIGENARLGNDCIIRANVTIYHGVVLGNEVSVHSGTVIGADGFGYANNKGTWIKIPQTGAVQIGDGTEVGANSCIDRGALDDTQIGKNCIIDNMVQIGHNCIIGDHSCICGSTGIAGSVTIGKHVIIAGGVGINGHITICDNVQVTGFSMVTKNITESGVYSSGMPAVPTREWQKNTVKLRSIDKLYERVKILEQQQSSSEA